MHPNGAQGWFSGALCGQTFSLRHECGWSAGRHQLLGRRGPLLACPTAWTKMHESKRDSSRQEFESPETGHD